MSEEYKNFNEYTQPEEKPEDIEKATEAAGENAVTEEKKKGGIVGGLIALLFGFIADEMPAFYLTRMGIDLDSYLETYMSGNLQEASAAVESAFQLCPALLVMVGGVLLMGIISIILGVRSIKKNHGGRKVPGIIALILAISAISGAVLMLLSSVLLGAIK